MSKVPIGIYGLLKDSYLEDFSGFLFGKTQRFYQPYQYISFSYIFSIHKICSKDGVVEFIPFSFGLRPFA